MILLPHHLPTDTARNMAAHLNSARAMLSAKNFPAARRMVREALDKNTDDLAAWNLRIEIEMEDKAYKEAIRLSRLILERHPTNLGLREKEFFAVAQVRKKRAARKLAARFKEDFPHATGTIRNMGLTLDSLSENTNRVRDVLEEFSDYITDAEDKKNIGTGYHNINDPIRAQAMLLEAHEELPNDAELNTVLATNSFQLMKPATTRRHARLALQSDPTNRRMRYIIPASYLIYFPPFFVFGLVLCCFFSVQALFGKYAAYACIGLYFFFGGILMNLPMAAFQTLTQIPVVPWAKILMIFWIVTYVLMSFPQFFDMLFGRKKTVKLKRF